MPFELELPGVWLDALVEDVAATGLVLINTTPEADEVEVAASTTISLDIADLDGGAPDLAATQVYVQTNDGPEVLAFDAGTFQPGFAGPASATSAPQADVRRVTIDLTLALDSEMVVRVHVLSASTLGATLDTTYAFTVADTSPPQLLAATATGLQTVELEFNEDVLQVSAGNTNDALNPANYVFTRLTAPAVDVVVASVAVLTTGAVVLTTDIPLTPGASYQLVASNLEDLLGNPITAPFNMAVLAGFELPVPEGRAFSLLELVPEMNRQEDVTGALAAFLGILQEPTDLLLYDIDNFQDILDPDIASDGWVDAMLADLGNPFTFELELIDKRRLLRVLVDIYKQKGTCVGIQNAIRFFVGVEVTCDEYNSGDTWELGVSELGEGSILGPSSQFLLYSFTVVSPIVLTQVQRDEITEIVEYMKPAHTHFLGLIEPTIPDIIDHLELGLSELGETWELH